MFTTGVLCTVCGAQVYFNYLQSFGIELIEKWEDLPNFLFSKYLSTLHLVSYIVEVILEMSGQISF